MVFVLIFSIFCLLIQRDVNNSIANHHLFLFTYANNFLITCGFRFNIHDLFVYFLTAKSTTAAQVTTCFYLLMEIHCWLHVVFVLIFMIYFFTSAKWCQQQQCMSPPVFIYLCKSLADYDGTCWAVIRSDCYVIITVYLHKIPVYPSPWKMPVM